MIVWPPFNEDFSISELYLVSGRWLYILFCVGINKDSSGKHRRILEDLENNFSIPNFVKAKPQMTLCGNQVSIRLKGYENTIGKRFA